MEDTSSLAEAILEQIADAVIFADATGTIRRWNRAAALFGSSAAEALGQQRDLIIPKHLRAAQWVEVTTMRSVSMVQPHQSDRVMATPQSAVASSAQVAAQAQERLAAGLAMIAGYVDAYGYITFKTFVSFMSGNTTQTGFQTGQGHVAAAMPSLLPIGSFVIGAFTGTLLTHSGTPQARRRLFGVVAAVLAVSIGLTLRGWAGGAVSMATLSVAMGMMNTALSHVGALPVSLTFVTGTLIRMGTHLALALTRAPLQGAQGSWDTHGRRAFLLLGIWASFLIGALLGGAATSRFGVWVLLLPLLILLALAVFSRPQSANPDSSA